jgi:hypothetical protein
MSPYGTPPDSFEWQHPIAHAIVVVAIVVVLGGLVGWWLSQRY